MQKHSMEKNEKTQDNRVKKPRHKTSTNDTDDMPAKAVRVLIPLLGDDIAPRFDLAPEALIAIVEPKGRVSVEKSIVLSQSSAEALCRLIMAEKVDVVVCCAIEEEYYQYLIWKKIRVIDSVIGAYSQVLERLETGTIVSGESLLDSTE
jgi:predicted Fe-Mo cluster-binding NifX family protein